MKKLLVSVILLFFSMSMLNAQSFDKLWKEVEELQKKDHPSTLIQKLNQIYDKAKAEKNTAQMMRAFMMRQEQQWMISPDSAKRTIALLEQWAKATDNAVDRAVLHFIIADEMLAQDKPDSLVKSHFDEALADKKLLMETDAKRFVPILQKGYISVRFMGNTLLDVLTQSIRKSIRSTYRTKIDASSYTRQVMDFYEKMGRKDEALITRLQQMVDEGNLSSPTMRQELEDLLAKTERIEAKYYIYMVLAESYLMDDERATAMKLIDRAKAEFPSSPVACWADNLRAQILLPQFSYSASFPYPERATPFVVHSRNVRQWTVEIYRLDGYDPLLGAPSSVSQIKRYMKLLSRQHFDLSISPEYKQVTDTITLTMPEEGVYWVKSIADGQESGNLLSVSPYVAVAFPETDEGNQELVVVDRLTGHPVSGIHVGEVGKNKLGKVHTTDSEGRVFTDRRSESNLVIFSDKPKTSPFYVSGSALSESDFSETDVEEMGELYTDRAIYRPGQKVRIAGLYFQAKGHERQVMVGKSLMLTLKSTRGKKYGTKQVRTDDFGGFDVDFDLPGQLLTGVYLVSDDSHNSVYFEVEEYKRPTFEVKMERPKQSFSYGDEVKVEGRATTFSGVGVQEGKVVYEVRRFPAFWRTGATVLAKGELNTDTKGGFTIPVRLEKSKNTEKMAKRPWMADRFEVKAIVTSSAGETHEETINLYAGTKSLSLSAMLPSSPIVKENWKGARLDARNLMGESMSVPMEWQLFRTEKGEKGQIVAEGKATSGDTIALPEMKKAVSGVYRLAMKATDELGRVCADTTEFTLFSPTDKRVPNGEKSFIYLPQETFAPGKTAEVYWGTAEKEVKVLYRVYSDDVCLVSELLTMSDELRRFRLDYDRLNRLLNEKLDDDERHALQNVTATFTFVRENQQYTNQEVIQVELPDKRLDLKWETFRDKLQPGAKEEWTLRVSKNGKPVDARMFATLYDASLDQFAQHSWSIDLDFYREYDYIYIQLNNNRPIDDYIGFSPKLKECKFGLMNSGNFSVFRIPKSIPMLHETVGYAPGMPVEALAMESRTANLEAVIVKGVSKRKSNAEMNDSLGEHTVTDEAQRPTSAPMQLRENFNETAFFYPSLRTDKDGIVRLVFTMPDALTSWNFIGLAHTKEMDNGWLTGTTRTQKEFMVQPNMPRYLREGDRSTIAASLINLSEKAVKGEATLELLDPMTEKSLLKVTKKFNVAEQTTDVLLFECPIEQLPDVVICRIKAEGDTFADGEQRYLAVLSNRQPVTETIPFQIRGDGKQRVSLEALKGMGSKTAINRRLTVEMTANPAWYAIQALPVMNEVRTESVVDYVNALFANSVSAKIVRSNPHIRTVVKTWLNSPTKDAFVSKLQSNSELKAILDAETPWGGIAESETADKLRLAQLFDENTQEVLHTKFVQKLSELQASDGSYTWFKGMAGSQYLTTYVVVQLARMEQLGAHLFGDIAEQYRLAMHYLKKQVSEEVAEMKEHQRKGIVLQPSETALNYLYVCAMDQIWVEINMNRDDAEYLLTRMMNESAQLSIYGKSRMAMIMEAFGHQQKAKELLQSVNEYMVYSPEMGRYFDTPKALYTWRSYRIPSQVAAMEAVAAAKKDDSRLNDMALWLLKQKQVQRWESPVATAEAVYALLNFGGIVLNASTQMTAQVGNQTISTANDAIGYVKTTVKADAPKQINVTRSGPNVGWGSVFYQYEEKMNKVAATQGNGLKITRTFLRGGKEVDVQSLAVGDRITVRLTVSADRDMDFIEIKDSRAACMEPVETISGYRWGRGLAYYRVNRDASTQFFIDRMRKGTYVLDYDVFIDREGIYQLGAAVIQSAYAPEFTGQTAGGVLKVEHGR